MIYKLQWIAVGAVLIAAGCASSSTGSTEPMHAGDVDPAFAQAQLAQGGVLFAENCAECHGDAGQGTKKGPPLVGDGALPLEPRPGQERDAQFRTALDVYVWTFDNMPPEAPGSMDGEDLLAIMAFALTANGIELSDEGLNGNNATAIVLNE